MDGKLPTILSAYMADKRIDSIEVICPDEPCQDISEIEYNPHGRISGCRLRLTKKKRQPRKKRTNNHRR